MKKLLLETNISALNEGLELLSLLTHSHYIKGYKPAFNSTIGAHFRHVLEHYRCFMGQYESGEICYDNRQRDQRLESDIVYAHTTIENLMVSLRQLTKHDLNRSCKLKDQQLTDTVKSTIYRELLFLQSHTVHHFAIIAAMARSLGVQPADDFGVAIATRSYEHSVDNESMAATVAVERD